VWEFGNEPDLSRYINGNEAQWISSMLNPGYAAVKAVDGSNIVVSAGMAYPSNLGWIDGLKANGARFDVQAYHDYPGSAGEINSHGWALRKRMNADGYGNIPLWLAEFGLQETGVRDTSQQGLFTGVIGSDNPSTTIMWYNLRDDDVYKGQASVDHSEQYGLLGHDLSVKDGFCVFLRLVSTTPCNPHP
jgi:hypothetical protein